MADKLETLDDLFELQLKDLWSAETQLVTALPLPAQNARDGRLRAGCTRHLRETEKQVRRSERIGDELGVGLGGHPCQATAGVVAEGRETMSENTTDEVLDVALIAAAQRIEHYEIAGYRPAAPYAERRGYPAAAELLRQTLGEEQLTADRLNDLAESYISQKAE